IILTIPDQPRRRGRSGDSPETARTRRLSSTGPPRSLAGVPSPRRPDGPPHSRQERPASPAMEWVVPTHQADTLCELEQGASRESNEKRKKGTSRTGVPPGSVSY